jgi:hypothetical protein
MNATRSRQRDRAEQRGRVVYFTIYKKDEQGGKGTPSNAVGEHRRVVSRCSRSQFAVSSNQTKKSIAHPHTHGSKNVSNITLGKYTGRKKRSKGGTTKQLLTYVLFSVVVCLVRGRDFVLLASFPPPPRALSRNEIVLRLHVYISVCLYFIQSVATCTIAAAAVNILVSGPTPVLSKSNTHSFDIESYPYNPIIMIYHTTPSTTLYRFSLTHRASTVYDTSNAPPK